MSAEIEKFLNEFVNKYNFINAIWFFGSRANHRNKDENSDWDFLIFMDSSRFERIKKDLFLCQEADRLNIGLLLQINKNEFKSPWEHKSRIEKLNLSDLSWQTKSQTKAKYIGYVKNVEPLDRPNWMKPRNKEEEEAFNAFELGWPSPEPSFAYRVWPTQDNELIALPI